MRRYRFVSSIMVGLVFITLGFNRPQQQWTWVGLGVGFMLIGLLRWLRTRDRRVPPGDDSQSQL
jgi:membrane protease YdiL (CAAX protease family)